MRGRIAAVSAVLSVLLTALPAMAQAPTGQVTVVHGFRGLLADVYVDGQQILAGFAPERSAGPLELPAGPHEVRVLEAGAPTTGTPVLSGVVQVDAGANLSAVVHALPDGTPTLTVFVNDLSQLPAGNARLVVRHTAASGPVDVLLDGAAVATGVAPGGEAAQQLPAVPHQVAVAAAGQPQPIVPPAEVRVAEGASTVAYFIGSATDDSLGFVAQTIEGMGSAPGGVPTGTSGLAAEPDGPSAGPIALLAAVAALTLAPRIARRRPPPSRS